MHIYEIWIPTSSTTKVRWVPIKKYIDFRFLIYAIISIQFTCTSTKSIFIVI